ncbi:hypothetical protein ACIQHY_08205 [Streptomyces sp. NPDC092359]|uniref:hypothetical protein n=1 Tax=Streptomyces sp. NPDC092359 TaxID=3366014 RepID=UPI00380B772A
MATPKRAESAHHVPNHVPMSVLLASCAAARALSTPPDADQRPRRPATAEREGHGEDPEPVVRHRAA